MANANIVSLDAALRLTRANTLRSSSYKSKADRLKGLQRNRLSILEEKLFEAGTHLKPCEAGELSKPEGRFVCSSGSIWYYFSNPKRKFVLLDFQFGDGSSGGLPIPDRGDDDCLDMLGYAGLCAPSLRWVARGASGFSVSRLEAILLDLNHLGVIFRPLEYLYQLLAGFALHHREISRLTRREKLCTERSTICDDFYDGLVPASSILAQFVFSREQIENPYARSILIGEKLCHMAISTSVARSLFCTGSFDGRHSLDLISDVTSVVDSMLNGSTKLLYPLKSLELTKSIQDSLLADDSRFAFIQGELTIHLASFVAMSSLVDAEAEKATLKGNNGVAVGAIMKRYSLLAEFAYLSQKILRADFGLSAVLSNGVSDFDGRVSSSILREISSLCLSMSPLIVDLGKDAAYSNSDEDIYVTHDRILSVTKELLGNFEDCDS